MKSKIVRSFLSIFVSVGLLAGCSAGASSSVASQASQEQPSSSVSASSSEEKLQNESVASGSNIEAAPKEENPMIEITMNDGGKILLELDSEAAPITVENFVNLVNEGFYDGLTFHRIISGFMIQGGDPDGTGMGGSDATIKGEFKANGWDNPISHKRGVISMARSQMPDSASSQFFIVHEDSEFLDGNYAAFGHVVEGMDVVDAIADVPTGAQDAPKTPVVMETVRVVEEG